MHNQPRLHKVRACGLVGCYTKRENVMNRDKAPWVRGVITVLCASLLCNELYFIDDTSAQSSLYSCYMLVAGQVCFFSECPWMSQTSVIDLRRVSRQIQQLHLGIDGNDGEGRDADSEDEAYDIDTSMTPEQVRLDICIPIFTMMIVTMPFPPLTLRRPCDIHFSPKGRDYQQSKGGREGGRGVHY